jgi:predicted transcriptional regulator of viral defense system
MNDREKVRPNREGLYQLAAEQRGHFTTAQAHDYGYSRALLTHHVGAGTLRRVHTRVYRFRDYPAEPREEVVAAWLALGSEQAVVSHQSALELWGLSDVIPDAVHLTVSRSRRHFPRLPGAVVHTTTRPLRAEDVRAREGMRVTSPERTILDVAAAGVAPEQVETAIRQANERGWVEPDSLLAGAVTRGSRVAALVRRALTEHTPVA